MKAIENRDKKHLIDTDWKSIGTLFSKRFLTEELKDEVMKIINLEK